MFMNASYQEVNEQVEGDLVTAEIIAFPLLFLVSLGASPFESARQALQADVLEGDR